MGISREQAAENREAIVSAADRLFRERGVDAVGLTALMKEAGFTQGGFYNHFKSKDALVSAVMARAMAANEVLMAQGKGEASGDPAVASKVGVEQYLSTVHRDDVACGCPVAGFAGDVPRIGEEAQACYAKGLAASLERMTAAGVARGLTREQATRNAMARFSQMVGSLILSRAVVEADPALSDALLAAGRAAIEASDAGRAND
ncbi:TetR/AcrR family transcriptional regulator [Pandoraea sputorum]|uniref:TetR/AcrR family transcriptional regulator n=1 Tax=Pandoraea sputorum TaxID=93222 RepID=UPI001E5D083A|nr:TetR/AcrR family transcriptional regulator [Pandoraea sputorum]MCE4059854.1 TetR/AcrR family transcriptional regulator [Pandoraea sputorum]